MKCLHCEKCLEKKCDVYRSEQLNKAWNIFLDAIGTYKPIDWVIKKTR
jgi:hypothetical protein